MNKEMCQTEVESHERVVEDEDTEPMVDCGWCDEPIPAASVTHCAVCEEPVCMRPDCRRKCEWCQCGGNVICAKPDCSRVCERCDRVLCQFCIENVDPNGEAERGYFLGPCCGR